jgi:hypothetical protein
MSRCLPGPPARSPFGLVVGQLRRYGGPSGDSEFREDVTEVVFDGVWAEVKLGGDLLVGLAHHDEIGDLALAWRQRDRARLPAPAMSLGSASQLAQLTGSVVA